MADEPLEDFPERITEPANDDILDVSIESPPTVWTSHKIKWGVIKSALSGISGTLNTISMFTSGGTSIGNSPLTVSSGNVTLLNGTLGIGVAADPTTDVWVETDKIYPLYIDQDYTGGGCSAFFARSKGVSSGILIGGELYAKNSTTLNIAIKAIAGGIGISHDASSDGFSQVGAVLQTASSGTENVTAIYATVNGSGTGNAYAGLFKISNASTGDSIGLKVDSSSTSGSAYIGQFEDGNEGVGKVLTCITADGKAQWANSSSSDGWLGSQTRIKLSPWDVVSYNDKDGVSIQDDGGVVNDAAGKISEMITGVYIPTGYKATAFMIYASANISVELYESQIDDSTAVSKGSGNANTEVNITDVTSTTTNYLSILIVETGNDITGGYVTIEKL